MYTHTIKCARIQPITHFSTHTYTHVRTQTHTHTPVSNDWGLAGLSPQRTQHPDWRIAKPYAFLLGPRCSRKRWDAKRWGKAFGCRFKYTKLFRVCVLNVGLTQTCLHFQDACWCASQICMQIQEHLSETDFCYVTARRALLTYAGWRTLYLSFNTPHKYCCLPCGVTAVCFSIYLFWPCGVVRDWCKKLFWVAASHERREASPASSRSPPTASAPATAAASGTGWATGAGAAMKRPPGRPN